MANLQSLNRATSIKEGKSKSRQKVKPATLSEQNSETVSRAASPAYSDRFDELTPSEDEGAHVDDELPPPVSMLFRITKVVPELQDSTLHLFIESASTGF